MVIYRSGPKRLKFQRQGAGTHTHTHTCQLLIDFPSDRTHIMAQFPSPALLKDITLLMKFFLKRTPSQDRLRRIGLSDSSSANIDQTIQHARCFFISKFLRTRIVSLGAVCTCLHSL